VLLFPDPLHAIIFGVYFYLVYSCLCARPGPKYTKTAIFLALLPMIVSRSTAEVRFTGLSYISFRAYHVMMDAELLGSVGFFEFFTFLTFFPSVTAGPIDRLQNFGQQLRRGYESLNFANFTAGYQIFVVGAVMKFVLAELVTKAIELENPREFLDHFIGMYRYSAYLYFDFAGYSAMAIGCALMIGIRLPENFNHPYLAQNPTDFWRRFHITLGEWLRDYFFKPIYKFFYDVPLLATRPLLRQNLALFLTFLLMGCWNGLKPNYVLSGSLFGIYSAGYNSYIHWRKVNRRPASTSVWAKTGSIALTVTLCCFALYIFSGEYQL
jgi:membrane protein involved in D-alanine export